MNINDWLGRTVSANLAFATLRSESRKLNVPISSIFSEDVLDPWPVPEKMRLEMVIRMQIANLHGGEILANEVRIKKIEFLGISRYKFKLRFGFNLNSSYLSVHI